MRKPLPGLLCALVLTLAACSADGSQPSSQPSTTTASPPTTAAETATTATTAALAPATFVTRGGVFQVAVLDAAQGSAAAVVDSDGAVVAEGEVDAEGSWLARELQPGDYTVRIGDAVGEPVTVVGVDDTPPDSFYEDQELPAGGFGYLTTRDGTSLSVNVVLPGPAEDGPYPTVVEYSGYEPSNPDAGGLSQLYTTLGYAYVGVNMRGTGCSGGAFDFFDAAQRADGYDAIEAVAAQPWVLHNAVGMVGVSYPGISQLFVAATRPPSLAAITPLSVLDDSYRSTLYPGGILNTGFAVGWSQDRQAQAEPYGQAWTRARADAGDEECAANQRLRLQNADVLGRIEANPFYDPAVGDSIAPVTFVDRITVPVFLAGAWQDEQTGGHFPAMLDRFTGSPALYATIVNGTHIESLTAGIVQRYVEFLDLYVAKRVPSTALLNLAAGALYQGLTGVDPGPVSDDRFAGSTYEEALAAFEQERGIRVLFEQGAADGRPAGAPAPRFEARFASWPVPASDTAWYLAADGSLQAEPPSDPGPSLTAYRSDPTALPPTSYDGPSNGIWTASPTYRWQEPPAGTAASWVSGPLTSDTVVVGSGSVDLWLRSSAEDTDLEVTISEVRPDGEEMYVQSGWLRASRRALDEGASTATRPVHTFEEADAQPLPPGELVPVRVELFPMGHAFRAGSRIRISVDAPGGSRPLWAFDTIAAGEVNEIAHDADHPSRVVLPVVGGVAVPASLPACGAVRGQPCRAYSGG